MSTVSIKFINNETGLYSKSKLLQSPDLSVENRDSNLIDWSQLTTYKNNFFSLQYIIAAYPKFYNIFLTLGAQHHKQILSFTLDLQSFWQFFLIWKAGEWKLNLHYGRYQTNSVSFHKYDINQSGNILLVEVQTQAFYFPFSRLCTTTSTLNIIHCYKNIGPYFCRSAW